MFSATPGPSWERPPGGRGQQAAGEGAAARPTAGGESPALRQLPPRARDGASSALVNSLLLGIAQGSESWFSAARPQPRPRAAAGGRPRDWDIPVSARPCSQLRAQPGQTRFTTPRRATASQHVPELTLRPDTPRERLPRNGQCGWFLVSFCQEEQPNRLHREASASRFMAAPRAAHVQAGVTCKQAPGLPPHPPSAPWPGVVSHPSLQLDLGKERITGRRDLRVP